MRRQDITQFLAVAAISAALAMPGVAQQASTQNPDQNQATPAASAPAAEGQNQTTASTGAATPDTMSQQQVQQRRLVPQTRQGFWGKINPFARKKYVQTQLSPIRDRVNELDELTASNGRALTDLDSRATAGIHDAQSRANQASQTADQAQQQVQQVSTQATQLNQQVQQVNQNLQNADQYQVAQTAEMRFRPGAARLSRRAQDALSQFVGSLPNQNGYIVEVQAYSAGRGLAAVRNSQRLADTVVRYLVLHNNIPLYRIYTMGLGNTPVQASTGGEAPRRLTHGGRVEIRILHNSLAGTTAQNQGTQGSQASPMPNSNPGMNNNQMPMNQNQQMNNGQMNNGQMNQQNNQQSSQPANQ